MREPNYWQPPFDPGPELGAIAVPIISRSGLHGTLSLMWLVDEMDLEELLAMGSLNDLHRASARLGTKLDQKSVSAPEV